MGAEARSRWRMWLRTVSRLSCSISWIWEVDAPSASRWSTSFWRGISTGGAPSVRASWPAVPVEARLARFWHERCLHMQFRRRPGARLAGPACDDLLPLELRGPDCGRRRRPPGARAVPYLRSVRDPYDRASPHHRWSRRVGTGQLAAVAGLGDVRTVRTLINGSGRVRYVRLAGAGRSRRISGSALARALGLRLPSAWFRIERRAVMPTRD